MLNNPSTLANVAASHRTSELLTQADTYRMSALAAGSSSFTYVTNLRWSCGTLLVQIGNWLKGAPEAIAIDSREMQRTSSNTTAK